MARAFTNPGCCSLILLWLFANQGMAQQVDVVQQAISLEKKGDWEQALIILRESDDATCNPVRHHLAGIASSQLHRTEDTVRFENKALDCKPPLDDRYYEDAISLLKWARDELAHRASIGYTNTFSDQHLSSRTKDLLQEAGRHLAEPGANSEVVAPYDPCSLSVEAAAKCLQFGRPSSSESLVRPPQVAIPDR